MLHAQPKENVLGLEVQVHHLLQDLLHQAQKQNEEAWTFIGCQAALADQNVSKSLLLSVLFITLVFFLGISHSVAASTNMGATPSKKRPNIL